MDERTVVIEWRRLENWQDVEKMDKEEDYGLYQITGEHPVFGEHSLLYIGMAKDQTFRKRFTQHQNWLKSEWGITVYLGRVDSVDEDRDFHENLWKSVVEDAEALLIYFHAPPYNAKSISDQPDPTAPIRIINTGDYGALYPEISHKGLSLYDKYPRPSE